jgi:WD40 repeat protein
MDKSYNHIKCLLYISRDGLLISGSTNNMKLWDLFDSYKCVYTFLTNTGVFSLGELPNGYFASGERDGNIRIWNLDNYHCVSKLEGHKYSVKSILFLKDYRLASCSDDEIIIWNY